MAVTFQPQVCSKSKLIESHEAILNRSVYKQWTSKSIKQTSKHDVDIKLNNAPMDAPPDTFGKLDTPITPSKPYKSLTSGEAEHFLTHGWLKVEGAVDEKYMNDWLPDFWIRTGYDANDKATWENEYLFVAHHRQERNEDFCPKAWEKIVDLCGGEERIHETRERWIGDNFIVNFGSDERSKQDPASHPPQNKPFHVDNDWCDCVVEGHIE